MTCPFYTLWKCHQDVSERAEIQIHKDPEHKRGETRIWETRRRWSGANGFSGSERRPCAPKRSEPAPRHLEEAEIGGAEYFSRQDRRWSRTAGQLMACITLITCIPLTPCTCTLAEGPRSTLRRRELGGLLPAALGVKRWMPASTGSANAGTLHNESRAVLLCVAPQTSSQAYAAPPNKIWKDSLLGKLPTRDKLFSR